MSLHVNQLQRTPRRSPTTNRNSSPRNTSSIQSTNAIRKPFPGCGVSSERRISMAVTALFLCWGLHTLFLLAAAVPLTPVLPAGLSPEQHRQAAENTVDERPSSLRIESVPFAAPILQANSHTIPRILIFTHYRNLLDEQDSLTDEEEIVLAANIRKGISLHPPETLVRFLTDDKCVASLQRNFPSLVEFFLKEKQGMFKADICRGSALYETGGIYLDVDLGVRKDLWLDLWNVTEFVTARVHMKSMFPNNFFQAIIGAAPKSPIIYKYLELFYDYYTGKERIEKGPLGVILLRRAWDRVYDTETHEPVTELYQEVLYDKRLFPQLHPAPTWGVRRACHFLVVAPANSHEHTEVSWKGREFQVPLYSRIPGSRMCPLDSTHGNTTENKASNKATTK